MRILNGILVILAAIRTTISVALPINDLDLSFAKQNSPETITAIDKLSRTARVITAITLMNGLSDNSIPIDNVIAELMNLGSIELKTLEGFDKKKVEAFLKKLTETKMVGNGQWEKGIVDMQRMKKVWSNKDLSKIPDATAYTALEKIKKLDDSGLDKLSVKDANTQIGNFTSLSDQDIAKLKVTLKNITDTLQGASKSIKLQESIDLLSRWKSIAPIIHLFEIYDSLPIADHAEKKEKDQVTADINSLKELKSIDIKSSFGVLSSVISSRFIFHPTDRKYTTGFVNGFQDLSMLAEDVKDSSTVDLFEPATEIRGVKSLAFLYEPINDLDVKWTTLSTQAMHTSINQFDDLGILLSSVPGVPSSADVDSVFASIVKCQTARVNQAKTTKLVSQINSAENLSKKLIILKTIQDASRQNKIGEIIQSLSKKSKPDDVQRLKEFFVKLDPQLEVLNSGSTASSEIDKVKESSDILTKFDTDTYVQDYKKSFDCLAKLDGNFDEVARAVRTTSQILKVSSDKTMSDNIKKASAAVSESSKTLKSIRDSVTKFKSEKSSELKTFSDLKDLKKHSKLFGEAVNSLVSIKKANEKFNEFQSLISSGHLLEVEVKKKDNPNLDTEFKRKWGDFGTTTKEINTLFSEIDKWSGVSNMSHFKTLNDFTPIFSKYPKLADVDLKVEDRLAAVDGEKMQKEGTLKNYRDNFKAQLLDTARLDLQFSRFKSSVDQMPDTIKHVSGVLSGGGNSTAEKMTGKAKSNSGDYFMHINAWIVFLAMFVVGAIIAGLTAPQIYIADKKYKKYLEEVERIKKLRQQDSSLSSHESNLSTLKSVHK